MFVEQRLYTCAPGNTGEFLRMYVEEGRAPQTRHQGQPIGYYVSEIGPLNQITTLWAYASLDDRVERRRALFEDPGWNVLSGQGAPAADDPGNPHSRAGAVLQGTARGDRRAREDAMIAGRDLLDLLARCSRCAAVALSLWPHAAAAQDAYPSKPIKLVVPLAAGGGIDFTARTTAQKLSEVLGQQVVVENQGGAGGTLGVNAVVRAAPDGYTLLYHSVTGVVSAVVGKDLPYDWLKDLAPVSLVTRFAPVLIINPSLPAKDLKEFIALAKANPGKFSYGSSGAGTGIHLASELFKAAAGVDIVHVPYRGNAGVMPDLLAGRIAMLIDGVPPQVKNIESGVVRALAVTTRTRAAALPNVPTMIEQGVDYEVPYWTAIYAPAATPKPIIDKLAAEIAKTMRDPGVVGRLKDAGTEAVGSTPQELDVFNRDQFALYRRIVQDPRLQLNLRIDYSSECPRVVPAKAGRRPAIAAGGQAHRWRSSRAALAPQDDGR